MRASVVLVGLAVTALAAAPPALAHRGGKAEPQISAKATGTGYSRTVTVRLRDIDDGDPIPGATVSVAGEMKGPHLMRLIPHELPEVSKGTYRGRYPLIMRGNWTVDIEVTGRNVRTASARLPVMIGGGSATGGTQATALPTRLEANVTGRDFLTMFVLWVHGLAAMGWIIGVILMTIALSTEPLLAGAVRASILAAYQRWGVWLHWGFVPVIVATGIYNTIYVTPFTLRWPWSSSLDGIPYGNTYEAILFAKLGLFVVLLATGTVMLARVVRAAPRTLHGSDGPDGGPIRRLVSALGVPGILYVSTVPLILGAAMALRYVHILSHVAEVVNSR